MHVCMYVHVCMYERVYCVCVLYKPSILDNLRLFAQTPSISDNLRLFAQTSDSTFAHTILGLSNELREV